MVLNVLLEVGVMAAGFRKSVFKDFVVLEALVIVTSVSLSHHVSVLH
jgi:hypothetical protein